jgi:hypothetical protein
MDCVILLHFDWSVTQQFKLCCMRPHLLTFEKSSSFNELVVRVRAVMNVGYDLRLHERYDMEGRGDIPIYVMLYLGHKDE